MKVFDTNYILRFILQDIAEQSDKAEYILNNEVVFVPYEVIAEVAYVMIKVYKIKRQEAAKAIKEFTEIDNVLTENSYVTDKCMYLFNNTSLDFVDCLLCAYHTEENYEICTFDKKLLKLIRREDGTGRNDL